MRTPVVLICGQGDTNGVAEVLARASGTVVVRHEYDGQVVVRSVTTAEGTTAWPLELVKGCVTCTVRADLLVLLRRLNRRDDVNRIAVQLMPWLEPEPVCWAVENVRVRVGPGYTDGPAALDVRIEAVVTCVDSSVWLSQAVGDDDLNDGRTVAQVVVGQAEFADALVLTEPHAETLAVLRRLAPRARLTVGAVRAETALANLEPDSRRGRSDNPHDPLLAGQPSLASDGDVGLLLFSARRPFHPQRLHAALDVLLDGVVRARGRLWLANRFDDVMWLESAGRGMHFEYAGRWLAAMSTSEQAYADPQRAALAAADWHDRLGDRHVSIAVLVCGAKPDDVVAALRGALLTSQEWARPEEWSTYPDPFGDWHDEPCDEKSEYASDAARRHDGEDR
ncbi:ribosome hibernation factor-recruiting GTPase MRF [Mycobacterium deserti]|uniref:GTP-binding protein n=1 Tax=Mycobacterium deserti TaxID=2978347 RepID=A0ABT2M6N4_9MYCO|nr:GTP-binding protein [Mycobacterium deserti]MCT7657922.1 GTP-binding protein [Mycobacterium deserti]